MDKETARNVFVAEANLVPECNDGDALDFFSNSNLELEEDNPEIHRLLQALTRLIEPSVQVVCLSRSGSSLFLHDSDANQVDIHQKPDGDLLRGLLRRSLGISDKRIVFALIRQEPPDAWKESPALMHHRLLEFENGAAPLCIRIWQLLQERGNSVVQLSISITWR